MASKRVKIEELLSELSLTQEDFSKKLGEIKIKVTSRSKSLSLEQAKQLREYVVKKKVSLTEVRRGDVVERRVQGSVIRRRRVATSVASVEPEKKEQAQPKVAKEPEPKKNKISIKERAESIFKKVASSEKPKVERGIIKPTINIVVSKPKVEGAESVKSGVPTEEELEKAKAKAAEEEKELAKKRRKAFIKRRSEEFDINHFSRTDRIFQTKKKKVIDKSKMQKTQLTTPSASKRLVKMEETISVQDLSSAMKVKTSEIVKKLMSMGTMTTANQQIDEDTATLLAQEYGFEIQSHTISEDDLLKREPVNDKDLVLRSPVVTVMGHVDHGKTTLLDAIRETDVAEAEAGGITQHIGASMVLLDKKRRITFIDTPGHQAFSAMRARGAKTTDIVILVVAADDGVMPQTKEAIAHAKEAGVPIIVAVNKIDKPGADIQKIKQQLSDFELLAEDWGGKTIYSEVSAKQKTGIKELLEMVMLQAEILELKASPKMMAEGVVLEAKVAKGLGPVATVLIQKGTLKRGDTIVSGTSSGKARLMMDDKGKPLQKAEPSFAVEVSGLDSVPSAGEPFYAFKEEDDAKKLISFRQNRKRSRQVVQEEKISLEGLYEKMKEGDLHQLKFVVKADVQGSVEVVKETIEKLSTDKIKMKVIYTGAGGINESDVNLAAASNAVIIGFNVRPDAKAKVLIKSQKVDSKLYKVIYDVADDLKKAMLGVLKPTFKEVVQGQAEVRQVFKISRVGTIAGCSVTEGKITRKSKVRLLRDDKVIYEGELANLKRVKDDAREVAQGYECGIQIEDYNDIKKGDVIEAYTMEEEAQTL